MTPRQLHIFAVDWTLCLGLCLEGPLQSVSRRQTLQFDLGFDPILSQSQYDVANLEGTRIVIGYHYLVLALGKILVTRDVEHLVSNSLNRNDAIFRVGLDACNGHRLKGPLANTVLLDACFRRHKISHFVTTGIDVWKANDVSLRATYSPIVGHPQLEHACCTWPLITAGTPIGRDFNLAHANLNGIGRKILWFIRIPDEGIM